MVKLSSAELDSFFWNGCSPQANYPAKLVEIGILAKEREWVFMFND